MRRRQRRPRRPALGADNWPDRDDFAAALDAVDLRRVVTGCCYFGLGAEQVHDDRIGFQDRPYHPRAVARPVRRPAPVPIRFAPRPVDGFALGLLDRLADTQATEPSSADLRAALDRLVDDERDRVRAELVRRGDVEVVEGTLGGMRVTIYRWKP